MMNKIIFFFGLVFTLSTSARAQDLQTYLVTFLGKASRAELQQLKSELRSLNQGGKYQTYFSKYEDASQEVEDQQNVYLDRALVETSPEEMERFQQRDRDVPGLRIFYRRVERVQTTVTLSVTDLRGKSLLTVVLGPLSNVRPIAQCNLRDPSSCFFGDEARPVCRLIDANCLKHLVSARLLDGVIDVEGVEGPRPIIQVLFDVLQSAHVGEMRLTFSDMQLVDLQSEERDVVGDRSVAYSALAQKMDVVQIPSVRHLLDVPIGLIQPAKLQLNKHTQILGQMRDYLRSVLAFSGKNAELP